MKSVTECVTIKIAIAYNYITLRSSMKFMVGKRIITDHISDVTGVIVLTSSICVCVTTLTSGQTHRLEFWHGSQVEVYLGEVCRSRSQVKGQGQEVKRCSFLGSIDCLGRIAL